MLQTLKVLRAAVALHEFTVDEAAAHAEVPRRTVRTVLRRHSSWFPEVGTVATGRRGGQWAIYRTSREAAEEVARMLEEHIKAVGAPLGPPPGMPARPGPEGRLGAIEHILLTTPNHPSDEFATAAARSLAALEQMRSAIEAPGDTRLAARYATAKLLARTLGSLPADVTSGQADALRTEWREVLRGLSGGDLGRFARRVMERLDDSPWGGILAVELPPDLETSSARPSDHTTVSALSAPSRGSLWSIGVELLPHRLAAVLLDQFGNSRDRRVVTFDDMTYGAVVTRLARLVEDVSQALREELVPVDDVALGVEVGGPVDAATGVVHYLSKAPPISTVGVPAFLWEERPLGEALSKATGLRTVIENDANAFAMRELVRGIGCESEHFAVMLIREGIGGSIVRDGAIYPGPVEIGNFIFHDADSRWRRADAGHLGALESVAGTTAIIDAVAEVSSQEVRSIDEAADVADKLLAAEVPFTEAGLAVAHGMAWLISFCGASDIVIYGPAALLETGRRAADAFRRQIDNFTDLLPFEHLKSCKMQPPRVLDVWAGAEGAGLVALERWFGVTPSPGPAELLETC